MRLLHRLRAVSESIERVYNRPERDSATGMISPVEFETDSLRQHKPPDPVSTKRGQAPNRLREPVFKTIVGSGLSCVCRNPCGQLRRKRF